MGLKQYCEHGGEVCQECAGEFANLKRRVEALTALLERVLIAEDPEEYLDDVQAALRGGEMS